MHLFLMLIKKMRERVLYLYTATSKQVIKKMSTKFSDQLVISISSIGRISVSPTKYLSLFQVQFSIFRLPYPLSMATTLELKDDRKVSEPQTDLKTVVESEIKYDPFPSTYLSTDATSSS